MAHIKELIVLMTFTFYLCGQAVVAQNYYFEKYQVGDGLSYNTISCILQDAQGFMWFGTKDGLNRYDGYNFKVFQADGENPCSIGSNFIRSLHEYGGSIWVGTDSGLYRFDEKKDCFQPLELVGNKPILDISNDDHGYLWFIAAGKINSYDLETRKLNQHMLPNAKLAEWILKDKKGNILLSTKSELFIFNKTKKIFEPLPLQLNMDNDHPFLITKLYSLSKDTLLLGTKYHGALTYNISQKMITSLLDHEPFPVFVRDFAVGEKDQLWIGTESGIYLYDLATKTYQNLQKSFTDPLSLSDNAVYSVVKDSEGGMWIGTYFGGINYYAKSTTPFTKFLPKVGHNSISGTAVREIHKDQYGNLWIGTEDAGLNKYDPKTDRFENFTINPDGSGLSYYNIHGLLPLGDELWIGTFEHGLDVMDIKTGKVIRHYSADGTNGALRSDFVIDIYRSRAGSLYILTSAGVHLYRPATDDFEVVDSFPPDHHYSCIYEDKEGTLWAGTYWDGLYYHNPKTEEKGFYTHDEQNAKSVSSNVINSIFQDSEGRLWITTENGLNRFDFDQKSFEHYTKRDGLPSNVSYSILEDDRGNLWISTAGGMVDFDPDSGKMDVYTKANGLLNDQFNYNSAFKDDDGHMYFGSVYGMIRFDPKTFRPMDNDAPILFTGLQINNEEVRVDQKDSPLQKSIGFTSAIELGPEQSSFSLEFAALHYQAPEMTEYWYTMEGLNDSWVNLKQNHKLNFTKLPAGEYVLHLKSRNSQGVWNVQTASMDITVLPPFYRSTWAYVVYLLIFFSLIYFLLRLYHQRTQRKNERRIMRLNNEKEKELYQAKIEFFTNVAHEIRTPLTLIKGPLEKLLKKEKQKPTEIRQDLAIMDKNTGRLLHLVNELLDFRKSESRSLELSFVELDIAALLKDMLLRFTPAIDAKGITINIEAKVEQAYAFCDEEAVKKILSNLFDNAIKYAEKRVVILLTKTDQTVGITFKNDGKRIPFALSGKIFEPFFRIAGEGVLARKGTGIGLPMARSLAHLHHGDLTFESSDPTFNCFELQLPVHQEVEFGLYSTSIDKNINALKPYGLRKTLDNTEKPVLLIVEDNNELLEFMAEELSEGYTLLTAENGQIALDLIAQEDVQLIVSDVKMPVMDGVTFCRKIKNTLETSHIPLILLTAKSALDDRVEGLESGADAYVVKPFSMDYLQAQIKTLLENRRHIMDFYASSPLSHIRSIRHSKTDSAFIVRLDKHILAHIADPALNVDVLAEMLNMSRSSLYRKINDLSNLTPNELINVTRLKRAAELLATGQHKIYEVAEQVGYRSQTSFGRSFQKQFKMTPTNYIRSNQIEKSRI